MKNITANRQRKNNEKRNLSQRHLFSFVKIHINCLCILLYVSLFYRGNVKAQDWLIFTILCINCASLTLSDVVPGCSLAKSTFGIPAGEFSVFIGDAIGTLAGFAHTASNFPTRCFVFPEPHGFTPFTIFAVKLKFYKQQQKPLGIFWVSC